MGKNRCVLKCVQTDNERIFKVPANENDRNAWVDFITAARGPSLTLPKHIFLCSRHFKDCCFSRYSLCNARITAGHHPSIFNGKQISNNNTSLCTQKIRQVDQEPTNVELDYQVERELETEDVTNQIHCEDKATRLQYELTISSDALAYAEEELRRMRARLLEVEQRLSHVTKELNDARKDNKLLQQQCTATKNNLERSYKRNSSYSKTKNRLSKSLNKKRKLLKKCEDELGKTKKRRKPDEECSRSGVKLLSCGKKTIPRSKFTPEMREFAFKIHYASPKAYKLLRKLVGKSSLPHPRTFQNWIVGINSSPGLLETSMEYLKRTIENTDHQILLSLSLDEVSTRKQLIHSKSGWTGYVDYGSLAPCDKPNELASSALFLYINEINGTRRFPIAYVMTNGLTANLISSILVKVLTELGRIRARVVSVTFDGLSANMAAVEKLGANLNIDDPDFKPNFPHPLFEMEKVHVILDPCHMLKCLRNALKEYKSLTSESGNLIEWKYYEELLDLQNKCGLRLANKLSVRHVKYDNQKMKVNLAAQTLSRSVAIALDVCRKIGIAGFENSSGTSEFVKLIDRLFDALNATSQGIGMKSPLSRKNMKFWSPLFDKSCKYLMGLRQTSTGKPLYKTKRGTCIKGLITTMRSIENMLYDFVLTKKPMLKYIPTYKLSQDPLEIFFSALRYRFGRNDNPNSMQLQSAIKAMLCIHLDFDLNGNCKTQEDIPTNITTLSPLSSLKSIMEEEGHSRNLYSLLEEEDEDDETEQPNHDFDPFPLSVYQNRELHTYLDNAVVYVSGYVGRGVSKSLSCPSCIASLYPKDISSIHFDPEFILLNARNCGDLYIPSDDLVSACKHTEREIRRLQGFGVHHIKVDKILKAVIRNANEDPLFTELWSNGCVCHSHRLDLISVIVERYCNIRLHYIAKQYTLRQIPETSRNKNLKSTHFQGS